MVELTILTGFGLGWWLAGTYRWPAAMVLGVLVAAVLWGMGHRVGLADTGVGPGGLPAKRAWNWYAVVNVLQVIAILVAARLAVLASLVAATSALVATIVGVHFVPLARIFGRPGYYVVGLSLIALGVSGTVAAIADASGMTVQTVVGLASAVILWTMGAVRIRQHLRKVVSVR